VSDFLRITQQRALNVGNPALLQVGFDVAVLDRYRADPACQVMRTDTVGRVRKQGGFTIDFGISPGEASIHASWQALTTSLPETERDHWASHASPVAGYSDMFLRMALSPSSCFDDGELRPW
jgi:hypothetical protein